MHSPKSSLATKPSFETEWNLASTVLHDSSASQALVLLLLLMNLRPFRACWALDLVRWSLAPILRASRADMTVLSSTCISSSIEMPDALDVDLSHGNFRRILDVTERFLSRRGSSLVGVTLHTTTESSSSSSVTSTKSCGLLWLKPLRKIGSIGPPPVSSRSSGSSKERL